MAYFNKDNEVIESTKNITVAISTREGGAEIIVKALNHFFNVNYENFTKNEAVEMMHRNMASGLKQIANFVEKQGYDSEQIIDYLRELEEASLAQSLVVALRDELKFSAP